MQITLEMFQLLCESAKIASSYFKFVRGMGKKGASSDEQFMSCYCQVSDISPLPIDCTTGEEDNSFNYGQY
jgi:hypothetical protein